MKSDGDFSNDAVCVYVATVALSASAVATSPAVRATSHTHAEGDEGLSEGRTDWPHANAAAEGVEQRRGL